MDSREQFEQWARIVGPEPDFTRANSGMNYVDSAIDIAWLAWKASRAAIEIQLPQGGYYCGHGCEHMMETRDVRDVLTEAGLKIKGES